MDGFRTRGQALAVDAVKALLANGVPQALLLVGPEGAGKVTLALDLAAAILCREPDLAARPCRHCRACRQVEHGNHPDLHRLEPVGAGAVIPIGGGAEQGVRDLIGELALLPVEGGARIAIIAAADRMTEDAQSAFLKTLEEPPAGSVLILCASDEDRLLPTIRSRCVRIRLGPLAPADVAAVVVERGFADATAATRAARLAGGRPGVALAYAAAPEAATIRAEIARTLIDLFDATRTQRLAGVRDLATRSAELTRALARGAARAAAAQGGILTAASERPRATGARASRAQAVTDAPTDQGEPGGEPEAGGRTTRIPAAERRAAATAVVEIWRETLRDIVLVGLGEPGRVRVVELLDELEAVVPRLGSDSAGRHLMGLERAGEQLAGNVSPELVLDVLALRWRPEAGVSPNVLPVGAATR
jgi:DNA polymerase-3 subunit delta'